MKVIIINGPNLNLIGIREPHIYGNTTFEDYYKDLCKTFPGINLHYYQSNVEGELINKIQEAGFQMDGIILNAGGYTHTSVAIGDAIASVPARVVEVHISNIFAREAIRQQSMLSPKCCGVISGFGLHSYRLALDYFKI